MKNRKFVCVIMTGKTIKGKLFLELNVSHIGVPGFDTSLQLPTAGSCRCRPGEAASDGSSNWVSATHLGDLR